MLRLRHIFTTTGAMFLSGGLSLLLTMLVARLLTPIQNGHYAQFTLIFNLYFILINFGLGPASTYLISSSQVGERRVMLFNIKAVFVIGVMSSILCLVLNMDRVWHWIELQFKIPLQILNFGIITGFFLFVFYQCIAILMGKKRFDTINLLNILKAALPLLAVWVAMLVKLDETGFTFSIMIALVSVSIISSSYILREVVNTPLELQNKTISTLSMFRYGSLVYASNVLHYFSMRGLMLILSYFYSPDYVGFFSIALVLLEAVLIIPSAVGQLIFPQSSSPHFDHGLTDTIIRLNVYVGLLTIAGVILFAPHIIEVILGNKYQLAAVACTHLTPSILLLAVPRILSQVLAGQGHPEFPLYAALISFFLGGSLAFWCIPAYGLVGAAWVINFISAVTMIVTVYGYTRLHCVKFIEVFYPRQSDFNFIGSTIRRLMVNK